MITNKQSNAIGVHVAAVMIAERMLSGLQREEVIKSLKDDFNDKWGFTGGHDKPYH